MSPGLAGLNILTTISLIGFVERLSAELQLQHQDKINIVAVPERKFSAWIGGSIWAKDEMSRGCWIDKHEYDEYGPSVIHSKCL